MRFIRYLLQGVGLAIMLIFYVLPVLMLPFVHELPYLHQLTLGQRLQISALFFSLSYIFGFVGASPRNRKLSIGMMKGTKNLIKVGLGFILAIFAGAYWNGNIMGILVLHTLPTEAYLEQLQVKEVKYQGSKHPSVYLKLHSETKGQDYYLTLSRKHFDYPTIRSDDRMIFKGQENIFGIYVNDYEFE